MEETKIKGQPWADGEIRGADPQKEMSLFYPISGSVHMGVPKEWLEP